MEELEEEKKEEEEEEEWAVGAPGTGAWRGCLPPVRSELETEVHPGPKPP